MSSLKSPDLNNYVARHYYAQQVRSTNHISGRVVRRVRTVLHAGYVLNRVPILLYVYSTSVLVWPLHTCEYRIRCVA